MQLNQTTDYAIRTALFLAMEQRIVSSQEISETVHIPQAYILKFTKVMARAGIVQAYRGVHGGIQLKNQESTLLDIIRLMEPTIKINRCLEAGGCCSHMKGDSCPVCMVYGDVQKYIEKKLGSTTLRQLTGPKEGGIEGGGQQGE